MASAKITLMGMYHWDPTLFDEMVLPAGIDKDLLTQSLLLRGAEFEVLYSDPDFMKHAVGVWSNKWFRTFAEWLRGTQAEWNPVYNYDRFEDITDNNTRSYDSKTKADFSDTRTANLKDQRTANLTDKKTVDLKDQRTANLIETRTDDLTETRTPDLTHERTDDLTQERTPDLNDTYLLALCI